MKVGISAVGSTLDAEIDPRFGRCPYFIIVDPDTMEFEAIENSGGSASGGAGIATAQAVAAKGVGVLITGNCGPNAYQVLAASSIKVITGISGKVRDAVQNYKSGKLQAVNQPNADAHSGMGRGMGGGGGRGRGQRP
jgi:predicted Fe-Mo cluster-binding NifX family protein